MAAPEIGLSSVHCKRQVALLTRDVFEAFTEKGVSATLHATVRPAHTDIARAVTAALRDVTDAVLARDERRVGQLGVVRAAGVRGASSTGRGGRGRAATLPSAPAAMW
jgi:hypothetical protein